VLTSLVIALILLDIGVVWARRSRIRFVSADDAFRCRFRACGSTSTAWPGLARHCTRRWSRRMWARWAGDVLIVSRGPLLPRIISLRAQMCPAGVYTVPPDGPLGFDCPVAAGLRLCDGTAVEVVTARDDRLALIGPYLVAAIRDGQHLPFRHTFDVREYQPDDQDERR
jgi:hypothetical protein